MSCKIDCLMKIVFALRCNVAFTHDSYWPWLPAVACCLSRIVIFLTNWFSIWWFALEFICLNCFARFDWRLILPLELKCLNAWNERTTAWQPLTSTLIWRFIWMDCSSAASYFHFGLFAWNWCTTSTRLLFHHNQFYGRLYSLIDPYDPNDACWIVSLALELPQRWLYSNLCYLIGPWNV